MTQTQYLVAASTNGFIADSLDSLDWLFEAEGMASAAATAAKEARFSSRTPE
jgi:hypothetical protein